MRKQVFSSLLQFIVLGAFGQSIQFQNQWNNQSSDTIYVGVENVFKMSGPVKDLIRIHSDQASIKLNGNSFSIYPVYPGNVKVELITTTGKTESVFTSVYLPLVIVVFEGTNGKETTNLKMEDLSQLKRLAVKCPASNNFINGFEIVSFVVTCNGRSYEFQGDSFGDSYKMLQGLRPDDILHLEKANLVNKSTGAKMITAMTSELHVK